MMSYRIAAIVTCLILTGACAPHQAGSVLPAAPDYEYIEYLSDHLAIGALEGGFYLITPDGTVVASSDDAQTLRDSADAAWARFQDEEYACWDEILAQYDSLCNACIAQLPADGLMDRLETLRTKIQGAVGKMDPQQQARFAAIRERYEKYRR